MRRREYIRRWRDPNYARRIEREAARIQANGCSGVPEFYHVICLEHDIHYAAHADFATGQPIEQEDADLFLKWGIQHFSWFGRWSPMAWWRYRALSLKHLGFGRNSWDTGPARLTARVVPRGRA